MRIFILAFTALAFCSVHSAGEEKSSKTSISKSLNETILEYAFAKKQLGEQHPKLVGMKSEIADRTIAGERLDLSDLDATLARCYRDYQSKRESLSLRHPETQNSLEKLSIATKLLSYESEHFAKHWEQLLD